MASHQLLPQLDLLRDLPVALLDQLQQAFLSGEDWPPPSLLSPRRFPLTPALIASLSAHGSLRNGVQARRNGALPRASCSPAPPPALEPPGVGTSVQGRPCNLPAWLQEAKESSRISELLIHSIEAGPAKLMENKNGVKISNHVDFGVKRAGWPIKDGSMPNYGQEPPAYYRSVTVVNDGLEELVLIDICGLPPIDDTVILHDDYHLAHHHHTSVPVTKDDTTKAGVKLQPKQEYQVIVELRCWPKDCSFHQQWLLFIFGKDSTHGGSKEGRTLFVIGRRITAWITRHIEDLQTALSTEAKPFFPTALRCLFETTPAKFSVAEPRPRLPFMECPAVPPASRRGSLLTVWANFVHQLEQILQPWNYAEDKVVNPSHNDMGHEEVNKGSLVAIQKGHCLCFSWILRQLSRLLALEEEAMDHDIKSFDLFYAHLCYHSGSLFCLEVPGLSENRPSVLVGDVVYVRWASHPTIECASVVYAVEFIPTPKLILRLSEEFLTLILSSNHQTEASYISGALKKQSVHARFSFDRLMFKRMHEALSRVAKSSVSIFPCFCSGGSRKLSERTVDPTTCSNSTDGTSRRVAFSDPLKLRNQCLNEEQQAAIKNVLGHVSGPEPQIIFGPPGTGKTVTVVECTLQVVGRDPAAKVCVCAPSNYAADILCSGIAAGGISTSKMWRLNDPRRTIASVKTDVLPFCIYNSNLGLFDMHPDPSFLQVIVCTCGAADFLHKYLPLRIGMLTHIFVDEAGQALIPEVLIPLSLGCENTCTVLCGDPQQLGPVVHSNFGITNGLAKSLLEMLLFETRNEDKQKSGSIIKLIRNYRANKKLLALPSRMFYDNNLIAAAETDVSPPREWEELNGAEFPILFYGVKGQQMFEGESPSLFNPVEATKTADLIEGLLASTGIKVGDIGVMAPYRRQVQKLRLVLRSRNLGAIRVGTVDDYQGQEERVIFISTVVTTTKSAKLTSENQFGPHIGFLNNEKRFNVSITRAKAMLVVIGHPLVLSQDRNWRELLQYCLAHDAFRGYGSRIFPTIATPGFTPQDIDFDDSNDDIETSRAIKKLAELSLLGMGDLDRLYPESLDSVYAGSSEDLEWRVMP